MVEEGKIDCACLFERIQEVQGINQTHREVNTWIGSMRFLVFLCGWGLVVWITWFEIGVSDDKELGFSWTTWDGYVSNEDANTTVHS